MERVQSFQQYYMNKTTTEHHFDKDKWNSIIVKKIGKLANGNIWANEQWWQNNSKQMK